MNVKDRRGQWFAAPAALAVLVAASLASASAGAQSGEDSDWPSVNGTLDGQRYSPLTQIGTTSVNGLKVAWRFRVSTPGAEAYPVVVGRTAYVTTTYGNMYALDAVTGKKLWLWNALKEQHIGIAQAAVHGFP